MLGDLYRDLLAQDIGYALSKRSTCVGAVVVPPFLKVLRGRGHAAMGNFCFGGTPPMAVFGRS